MLEQKIRKHELKVNNRIWFWYPRYSSRCRDHLISYGKIIGDLQLKEIRKGIEFALYLAMKTVMFENI